jgi:membrane-associated protein
MEYLAQIIDVFLHVDKYLDIIIRDFGAYTYLILFLIIFCETGLVVTPFLPGDSLLFAVGVMAARGSLDVNLIAALLVIAAILGDTVNYHVGYYLGGRVFSNPDSKIFRRSYLERTQRFYDKYGGKTIVFARFVPIVRTFAPLLAGVGKMNYMRFAVYNVAGGIIWILLFTYAGFFFSEIPAVKKNFSLVIVAIIFISVLPVAIEFIKARKEAKLKAA